MRRLPSLSEVARSFAVLFALCGLAIAQPLLDIFGRSPETFVFTGADTTAIIAFGALVVLVPAMVGLGLELVAGAVHPPARRVVHLGLIGLLVATWVIQALHQVVSWPSPIVMSVALAAGAASVSAYRRLEPVRLAMSYAAVAPLLFLGLFLFASPVSDLVLPSDAGTAPGGGATAPVVLLVLDELPLSTLMGPDGEIDAELYPNFAAFADESTWFRNATTTQGLTLQAVPAVFTGQDTGLVGPSPLWTNYPDSIFTLFGGTYSMNVSEAVTQICPPSLCSPSPSTDQTGPVGDLLARARTVWIDRLRGQDDDADLLDQFAEAVTSIPTGADEAQGEVSPERFEDFLDGLEAAGDQSLSAMHLILPHGPFTNLPSGHSYMDADAVSTGLFFEWPDGSDWPALLGRQRHVLQTQYTDALLGRMIAQLRESGLYDDAVVAVTADHGANFSAGAVYRGPNDDNYEQIMWIPMMVKAPGQDQGIIDDANVTNLDLLPTIAELAGVDVPFEVDGRSAIDRVPTVEDAKRFYRSNEPPFLPDPEVVLEYSMVEGSARVRDRLYPSLREGDPAWWPYQVGDHASLIGEPASTLTVGAPDSAEVILDDGQADALALVDLDDQGRPVFLSGRIDSPAGTDVLVAINGTIAGVSPVFVNFADENRFAVMIPEILLERENRLELYTIADGDPPTVRPLTL